MSGKGINAATGGAKQEVRDKHLVVNDAINRLQNQVEAANRLLCRARSDDTPAPPICEIGGCSLISFLAGDAAGIINNLTDNLCTIINELENELF